MKSKKFKTPGVYESVCQLDYRLKHALINNEKYHDISFSTLKSLRTCLINKWITLPDALKAIEQDYLEGALAFAGAMNEDGK